MNVNDKSNYGSFYEPSLIESGKSMSFVIGAIRDDHFDISGTAFIIGPNLAVTAKHVIEFFYRNLMPEVEFTGNGNYKRGPANPMFPRFMVEGKYFNDDHPNGLSLIIDTMTMSNFSDLVLMHFIIPSKSKLKYRFPLLHAVPPIIGSTIQAYGFESTNPDQQGYSHVVPKCSKGSVKSISWEERDRGFLNFSFFETDARFDPGMSGGPVYCYESGFLCGLVSAGSTGEFANGTYNPSIVACLFPLLALSMELDIKGRKTKRLYSLRQIIQLGFVKMAGYEVFRIKYDPITKKPTEIIVPPQKLIR